MIRPQQYHKDVVKTYLNLVDRLYTSVYPVSEETFLSAFKGIQWLLCHDHILPDRYTFLSAFSWRDTPEGHKFWEDINRLCIYNGHHTQNNQPKDTMELI